MEIYCDNAATTALDPEVIEAILPFLTHHYGNPSSSHWAGRKIKEAINRSRETVAAILGASPNEIFFTSGATEANNLAITGAIQILDDLGITVSGGSACSNLAGGNSHVISALPCERDKENVRFSFSKFNTFEEVDYIVDALVGIFETEPVSKKGDLQLAII